MHGRYAGGFLGYDVFAEEVGADACDKLKLDPISCAGQCILPKLKIFVDRFAFSKLAIDIITCPEVFHKVVKPPTAQDPFKTTATADKWKDHLDALEKTTPQPILAEVYVGEVFGVCTYFAVPKDEQSARAIFNGRRFSLACDAPPPTNLPDIIVLLEALSSLHGDSISMVEGDIRHFFHQLKMNEKISQFFCIRRGPGKKDFRRWTTLPMGWSFSPFIAQSVSMGLVLSALARCGISVAEYEELNTPPPLIKKYGEDGNLFLVAAVWYDNILLCTSRADVALMFYQLFKATCDEIDLKLKRWVMHSPKSFRQADPSTEAVSSSIALSQGLLPRPSYLNLEFKRMNKRHVDGTLRPHFSWRISSKQIDKVQQLIAVLTDRDEKHLTFRVAAKAVGTVLWQKHLSFIPLCRLAPIIEISRTIGTEAPKKGWDSRMDMSRAEIDSLISHLVAIAANEWMCMPSTSRLVTSEVTVATDSSDNLWGALVWSPDRCLLPELSVIARRWKRSLRMAHIFAKELTAAVILIERICARFSFTEIVLIIDNTAAACVLRRMASSTTIGMELALRADAALTRANNTLKVIDITSKANPSDEPSRNLPLDTRKFALMWQLIDCSRRGIRANLPVKKFKRHDFNYIRHIEVDSFQPDGDGAESASDEEVDSDVSSDGEDWDMEADFDCWAI